MTNNPAQNHRFRTQEITIDPGPPRFLAPNDAQSFVVTLGTSTPSPNPYRFGAAGAVIANEVPYLIDAGEGIIRALAKAATSHNQRLVDCFAPKKLTHLFITHLHPDHVIGLPSLILNPWIFGREKPLTVFGPRGTKNLVERTLEAYRKDIHERIHGPEHTNHTGCQVIVTEIPAEGFVFEDDNINVTAFEHTHGTLQNYGYQLITPDRKIIWTGDGKASSSFLEAARGADVLVSEICTLENIGNSPWGGMSLEEKEKVIWSYHIKPQELAQLASQAKVKKLVLIHESNYSSPYNPQALLDEIKGHYSGEVISSRDGDVY